jgi:hypothetical protein
MTKATFRDRFEIAYTVPVTLGDAGVHLATPVTLGDAGVHLATRGELVDLDLDVDGDGDATSRGSSPRSSKAFRAAVPRRAGDGRRAVGRHGGRSSGGPRGQRARAAGDRGARISSMAPHATLAYISRAMKPSCQAPASHRGACRFPAPAPLLVAGVLTLITGRAAGEPPPSEPPPPVPAPSQPPPLAEPSASPPVAEPPSSPPPAPAPLEPPPVGPPHSALPPTPRGPPRFELGDADNRLRVEAFVQLRVDAVTDRLGDDAIDPTVEVRRLRLRFTGDLLRGALRSSLHLGFDPGRGTELFDVFVDARIEGPWVLRVGQWKVPYTRWRINSFARLALGEWGPNLQWFGSERQIGLALHDGAERSPDGFELQAGVFTGVNARPVHGNGVALVSGDPVPGHSSLTGRNEPPHLHPELIVHAAWNGSGVDTSSEIDRTREASVRASFGVSGAWDLRPDVWRDFALRLAPEAWVKWLGLSLIVLGHFGWRARAVGLDVGTQAGPADLGGLAASGLMAQLSYRFQVPVALSARVSWVFVDPGFARDARERTAALLAAAPDDAALARRYATAGRVLEEGEVSAAVSWELDEGFITLWLEGAYLSRLPDEGPRQHGARGRLQAQIAL